MRERRKKGWITCIFGYPFPHVLQQWPRSGLCLDRFLWGSDYSTVDSRCSRIPFLPLPRGTFPSVCTPSTEKEEWTLVIRWNKEYTCSLSNCVDRNIVFESISTTADDFISSPYISVKSFGWSNKNLDFLVAGESRKSLVSIKFSNKPKFGGIKIVQNFVGTTKNIYYLNIATKQHL